MTSNERRKTNQNNLEDKLLSIRMKELDRQSSNVQQQIKRDRYKLLDQYLDSKAQNLNYAKKRFSLPDGSEDMDLKTVLKTIENQTKSSKSKDTTTELRYTIYKYIILKLELFRI